MKINLREVVIAILIFVVVFAVVQISIGSYQVEMESMKPTLLPKDCIMVDKLTYRFTTPHRGQVVILWPPYKTENPFIKRVIGLPGETVEIRDGRVYIKKKNGDEFLALQEKPTMPDCGVKNGTWTLGRGEYFVLGDNRSNSQDSTAFGPVKRSKFIGKTWLRYWPLSRFGLTPHYSYKLESPTVSASATSIILPAIDLASLSASTP